MSDEEVYTTGLESRVTRHKKNQKKKRYMFVILFTLILAICIAFISILFNTEPVVSETEKQSKISHVASHNDDQAQLKKAAASPEVEKDEEKKGPINKSETKEKEIEATNTKAAVEENNQSSIATKIQPKQVIQHQVQPNETLFEIAMIYYSSGDAQEKIANYNGITNPEKEVQSGKVLEIPDPQYMFSHQVEKGDTIQKISQRYYGTTEYMHALANYNGLPNVHHVTYGTSILIPNPTLLQKEIAVSDEIVKKETNLSEDSKTSGVYRIEVSKTKNELYVFKGEQLVKKFSVGTGREASMTPVGEFTIVNKLEKPWYSGEGIPGGSPDNPLGSHWLGLSVPGTNGTIYGIHGTNNPSSVGKYVSLGCIRMRNVDVQWIYDSVPLGTVVHIY